MTRYTRNVTRVFVVMTLSLSLLLPLACESDEGGTETSSCDDCFKARVKDFQNKTLLPGGECYLLYNVYPDPNTTEDVAKLGQRVADADMPAGYTQPLISGEGGSLEIMLPAGTKWGFECDLECAGSDCYKKTYQFNISADTRDYDAEDIWIISKGMYTLAPSLAGIDLNQKLGVVAGRLVWYDAADVEEYVGCGELTLETSDGSQDYEVRYFGGNDMPTSDDPDLGGRESTNPKNGLFISANMPLGDVNMTMRIGDTIVGQEKIFSEGGSVVISNINVGEALGGSTDATFDANPTPSDCRSSD